MILLTGATGLLGSHLALQLLEDGAALCAIYRTEASLEKTRSLFRLYNKEPLFGKIQWRCADLTDIPALETAFQNITHVYHCAALVSFNPADEQQLRKINIEGTANIVNCCLNSGVQKLCFVSSIAALGNPNPPQAVITEETEWNPEAPHSDYAISKYGAEIEVWRGFQEGLPVAIINPGVILGPGFWYEGSGEIFTKVSKGLRFYTKGATGFVAVNDVVRLLIQLMHSDISGERFIAVAEVVPFGQITKWVAASIHAQPPTVYAPRWLTSIAVFADWLQALLTRKRLLSSPMAAALHEVAAFSNQKVTTALGFNFEPVSKTIAQTGALFLKK